MSDVTTGFGSQLHINTGSGLVRVAEIDDIPELPSGDTSLYDTSSFDSVEYREFKKLPLKEGVDITITGNYVIGSTGESTLEAAEAASGPLPYEIHAPQDDEVYIFSGTALFYNLRFANPGDQKRTFSIVMKPTAKAVKELEA